MISHKSREVRRGRPSKVSKNFDRLYKAGKCRECSVVVTRMDFAKILGKFTKVKIQYESSSTPKVKQITETPSTNTNSRLKSNENGMVLIHRNAYNQHPVKDLLSSKKSKSNETTPRQTNNILKENNRLKKVTVTKDKNSNYNKKQENTNLKQYGIIFTKPINNTNNNDFKNKVSLTELLPVINKSILPSEEWGIDYFPKSEEPKEDKVYDRIAAELEDLMYNERKIEKPNEKTENGDNKIDEFPSIMDILNDNSDENTSKQSDQSNSIEFKSNLESSDVEAMLLGKSNMNSKTLESTPMDVDSTEMANLIEDVEQLSAIQETDKNDINDHKSHDTDGTDNAHSPSILDETLQKGIEEHLPTNDLQKENNPNSTKEEIKTDEVTTANEALMNEENTTTIELIKTENIKSQTDIKHENNISSTLAMVTHVVFQKCKNGKCYKSVTFPKNLKYSIELEGKSVEFVGAPSYISSVDDLKVLLQIVNESDLENNYVDH